MHNGCVASVIPPFHSAVDRAISYLDPVAGLLGVTDFFVSAKYDLPLRQMAWARRFFWRYGACHHRLMLRPTGRPGSLGGVQAKTKQR